MVARINVSIDNWLFKKIEAEREEKNINRSEFVTELLIKGLGVLDAERNN